MLRSQVGEAVRRTRARVRELRDVLARIHAKTERLQTVVECVLTLDAPGRTMADASRRPPCSSECSSCDAEGSGAARRRGACFVRPPTPPGVMHTRRR